jgi:hypothetical protein
VRKKFFQLILSSIISTVCKTQTVYHQAQIPYTSLGAYSRNFTDAFSFTCNQAILSSRKNITAGLYSEKRFALKELNFYSFVFAFPIPSGGIGIQMNYFGFADYNESKLGIAYGKKLGNMVDIGIQFDYNLFHISGYGNSTAINGEAGVVFHPAEKITVGLHVYNPFGGVINKNAGEKMASIFRFGIGYEASRQICMHVEIIKEENIPVNVNAGFQYAFAKQFFAGIGIETSSTSPYGCAGLHWKNFRIDLEVSYHLQLGFTPGIVFFFELKSKNQE